MENLLKNGEVKEKLKEHLGILTAIYTTVAH